MKKRVVLLICILGAVVLAAAAAVLLIPGAEELQAQAQWKDSAQGRYYLDANGQRVCGWQEIDGKQYYFDADTGILATDWLTLPEGTWLLDDNGRPTTGWYGSENGRYYFGEDGRMATGWVDFTEGSRYFDAQGVMAVGLTQVDSKHYFFDPQGLMCRGWQEFQGYRYHFREDGTMATGLLETQEGLFFLDTQGHMLTGWQETPLGKRHFSEAGAMTTGWLNEPEGLLYLDEDGIVCTGWLTLPEGTWLLQEDGHPHTGWLQTETARYYFLENGAMATGFHQIAGVLRYFDSQGNYIPLVNYANMVPGDYTAQLIILEGYYVDSTCLEPLKQMMAAARSDGLKCVLNSTYRSRQKQKNLWDNRYEEYLREGYSKSDAYRLTARRVAYPGTSEHELGLAVDITGTDALYAWFQAHSWEYGFIVRYQGEKEEITGIRDEPWHLRYVGTELAQLLWEQGLCLEEFFMQAN